MTIWKMTEIDVEELLMRTIAIYELNDSAVHHSGSAVQCSTVQCSTVQCSTVQWQCSGSAVQYSAVAVQCSTVQWQCSAVHCSEAASPRILIFLIHNNFVIMTNGYVVKTV